MDNVFHRLDGKGSPKYQDGFVTMLNVAIRERRPGAEISYFRCKWFMNCNLHVEFKRLDLLKQLSQLGGDISLFP